LAAVELLRIDGATLFDVQWTTPHLRTLGAVDVMRAEYLRPFGCGGSVNHGRRHDLPQSGVLEIHAARLEILEDARRSPRRRAPISRPPPRPRHDRTHPRRDPDEPQALIRTDDAKFEALGIAKRDVVTREQVVDVLVAHPEVMQRPVVFVGDRAVIAPARSEMLCSTSSTDGRSPIGLTGR